MGMAKPTKISTHAPTLSAFGGAVREMRKGMGLSQEALADIAGIDRSYMGGIERGEHNLALINIQRIANALKISVADLMLEAKL
jgi:transcriptional regulator with XRE-family HTH domain